MRLFRVVVSGGCNVTHGSNITGLIQICVFSRNKCLIISRHGQSSLWTGLPMHRHDR